jgi:hypothetical protein
MSMWRRAAFTALLLAPVVLILTAWCAFLPTDPDYWWHVRTGQLIAEQHSIPRSDPFSFTAQGNAWVDHEWLTELTQYVVQQQIGYVGNVLVFGAVMALTGLAMFRTCRVWGLGQLPSILLVLWAFGMSLPSAGVRPQTVTRLLLALSALLITEYVRNGSNRKLWVLPPLFALWSNLHGGFIIGLGLLGLASVGQIISWRIGRTTASPWPLVAVTAVSVAASLINPQGLDALLYPLPYLKGNSSLTFISEWQTPDLRQPAFYPFAASVLVAMLIGWARRPLGVVHILWGLVFGLLALQSIRNISLFATVGMPLIGARLAAEVPLLRRTVADWSHAGRMVALVSIGLTLSVGLWSAAEIGRGNALQVGREPSTRDYPSGAVEYVETHPMVGNMFNQYEWGGYLIDQLYPRYRVFMDGRPDVYGDALVEEFDRIDRASPGWNQALASHDVGFVIVRRDAPLAAALENEPGWRRAFEGPVERVYVRAGDPA